MSQLEILILAQLVIAPIIVIIFLALFLRHQKTTIAKLQTRLNNFQEEANTEALINYLQLAIDDTTAHCAQKSIDLDPETSAEDQAISLRYEALKYELDLLQLNKGEVTPWRTIVKPYTELATTYCDYIESIPEKVTIKFKGQMAEIDKEQQRLEAEINRMRDELEKLAPMQKFFTEGFDEDASKSEIELGLHNALVALCDTVDDAGEIREVVYLIHESYYDTGPAESTTFTVAKPTEPAEHTIELSNLISEQNNLINNLRTQLNQTEELEGASALLAHLDVLEQNLGATDIQIIQLEAQLKDATNTPSPDGGTETSPTQGEMSILIQQFIEDSAEMLERLHTLQNQNKQYMKENDELREQIASTVLASETGEDEGDAITTANL
ncbi:MAG: hypothetical protein COA99_04280 [Moraxellaceae bacterium]|nr:MAG: hypothetical protein COA99_04280 [Moraxellaceae bacterium]